MVIEGRYELVEPIGSGGMGEVWKAHDRRLRRFVAIKGLLDRNAVAAGSQAAAMQRARREAEAIAKIEHPNVVTVHDQLETDNQVWIVMKLLDAGSLADLLREQKVLAVPRAADIGHQILQGLRAVHAASVLHRDVKPGNVLVRDDGHVVLVDFGIATFEGATPLTRSGMVIGTPPYQAPELFFSGRPTPASDLWALGVTLYEMVEGRLPFDGREPWEVQASIEQSPHPVLRYAGPLAPVIQGLLRTDPDERLDTSTVDSMLREVLGAPQAAAPAGAAMQPPEPVPTPGPAVEPASAPGPPSASATPSAPEKAPATGSRKGAKRAVAVALAVAFLTTGGWLVANVADWGGKGEDKAGGGAAGADDRGGEAETQAWKEWTGAHPQLKIGVKADQRGLSLRGRKDSDGNHTYAGLDIDMAYKVARGLGYADKDVKFVEVTSGNRDSHLKRKAVDLVIASYTMRQSAEIDFVGPYYEAGRGFLVRKNSVRHGEIKDSSYLMAKKVEVCTAKGSTYAKDLPPLGFTLMKQLPATYQYCLEQLLSKETNVYAVASDDAVLAGYAQSGAVRMLDPIEGTEKYGVAMRSGTPALKKKVCTAVAAILKDTSGWNSMYQKHLAPLLKTPTLGVPDLDPKVCPEV